MPARLATALGLPSRDAFLAAYREHTDAVRKTYDELMDEEVMNAERSHAAPETGHPRVEPDSPPSLQ
jgi:hypothetical protein